MRTAILIALGAALAATVTSGTTEVRAQQARQLSIVTGGTGGVYYPLGGGFGNILGKAIPGVTATAQVTGGSVDNLRLIGSGKADIAFSQVDAAWDAINGTDKFTNGKLPIQALGVLYPNHMHVVSVESTGITSVAGMKGKRISVGANGSATEVYANRVLEAAGLDPMKDVVRERLSVAESANAVKDGKIQAFFWVGGLPTAAVTDLAATPNTTIKMIDFADLTAKMNAKYGPLYSETVIPMATYKGMKADNKNNAVWNILAVNANMTPDLAYQITRTLFDKRDDLGLVHAEGKNIKLELQSLKNSGIPFHPGALKYLAEKGVKVE